MFKLNSSQLNMFSTTYIYILKILLLFTVSFIYTSFYIIQNGSWFSWANTLLIQSRLLNSQFALGLQQFYLIKQDNSQASAR